MKFKHPIMTAFGALALSLSTVGFAATTVTVDGVKSAGEYTGTNSGTESLEWWNGHSSIYDLHDFTNKTENDLYWEINGSGSDYSLNIFVEVPTYARRMIWAEGCDYKGAGTDTDCNVLSNDYLEAYKDGSHHDSVKMDYGTQTGSEFFQLNGLTDKIGWQDEDNNGNGKTDSFGNTYTWATSREYLISEGICDTLFCAEYEMTSSLELMWLGLTSEQAALDLISSITDMELHLSDEARGLPPVSAVPIPAAAFLFGPALLGFMGLRRKAKNSVA